MAHRIPQTGFTTPQRAAFGFTLAELLIALSILGVIATFTIPKVLQAQQDQRYNAVAKEDVAAFSGAYQSYLAKNGHSTAMALTDLTPYLNYATFDTNQADTVDRPYNDTYNGGISPCGWWGFGGCVFFHNGSVAFIYNATGMNFNTTSGILPIQIDPDGKVTDGTTNGPGKSVDVYLGYNGSIVDDSAVNGCNSWGCFTPNPSFVPSWFHWN